MVPHQLRQGDSGARNRPQLSVIVSLSDLATDRPGRLADGTAVPASTASRLACDAVLHRIVMAGRSTVLDYGSGVRTVSPALWAALVVRDGHCRHPAATARRLGASPPRNTFLQGRPHVPFQPGHGL